MAGKIVGHFPRQHVCSLLSPRESEDEESVTRRGNTPLAFGSGLRQT